MVVSPVVIGSFTLDGGAMFGVVPKTLWQKLNPPSEKNLCTWGLNSILIQTGERKILVDTGIGHKQDEKFHSHFNPDEEGVQLSLIDQTHVHPEEITDVFLTHFHFDHVGGATLKIGDKIVPTFPNARYWTNEVHYDWAYKGNPREQASFLHENFVPLREQNKLHFIDVQKDDVEWLPSIHVRFLYGHTEAMMMLLIQHDNECIIFPTDLIPSRWHVRLPYIMSYDLQAKATLAEKERLLSELEGTDHKVFFQHDPELISGRIDRDERGRYKVS